MKLYTLFRTERPKTIPYPAARPRIGHIREYSSPPPPPIMPLKNFMESPVFITIALFTVTVSHLHYNVFERGCEAISGKSAKLPEIASHPR